MAIQTELPAWGTYFFICPYGPAELWNVKKYVFQVGTLTVGPPGRRTDSQPAGQAAAAGVRPPWQAAGASVAGPVPYRHCSVTLPVSAGGDVQTLNIQRADCGRGPVAGVGSGVGAGGAWAWKRRVPVALGPHSRTPAGGSLGRRKACLCGRGRKPLTDEEGSVSPKGQGARLGKEREAGRGSCSLVTLPRGNTLPGCWGAALGNRRGRQVA